jgi:hypothetical protein
MKNITVGSLFKPLINLLGRFHMTIFIVFITAGLSVAVLFLNSILTDTSAGEGYTSPIGAGSIDQTTLERIKELHTSDETIPTTVLPEGRINPFGE